MMKGRKVSFLPIFKEQCHYIGNKIKNAETASIIKIALCLVLFAFLVFVYHSSSAIDVPMSKIDYALRSDTDIAKMRKCNDRDLVRFIGLNHSDYKGYLYYKSKEALGVDEVLIVKVISKEQLTDLRTAVNTRIDSQIHTFESYGPEQVAMLKNAIIYTRGKYLYYSTAKNPDKYLGVLKHVI